MSDTTRFGLDLLLVGATGLFALVTHRLTSVLRIPAPALILAAAAVAVKAVSSLEAPDPHLVEQVVTVALVYILFEGGLHIGWYRLRPALGPVLSLGIVGTAVTVGGAAVVVHAITNLPWYQAVLLGTAVAPTDPAVVFSVFGNREVQGHGGTVLEGESGANDPVGIALMTSLIAAGGLTASAWGSTGREFGLQMVIGVAIGLVGAGAVALISQRVALPNDSLYSLRSVAFVLVIFGTAVVARGSGFLAVFVAGICLGNVHLPHRRQIRQFHGDLASIGEVVAFIALGLTVDLGVLGRTDVWVPGLVLALALTFVIRPIAGALCLAGSRLDRRERAFVSLAGLKGAVPILLGLLLLAHHIRGAERAYGIVVVVVVFSVVVQGGMVPLIARWLRIPLRTIQPRAVTAEK